jgi:hypothetical protein
MKRHLLLTAIALAAATLHAAAQGSLTPPPGTPAPAMKSLQEIWEKIASLESQNTALSGQLSAQQNQIATLTTQNQVLTNLALSLGAGTGTLPWNFDSIEGGSNLSMAVASNGDIGISYIRNSAVKFARYNGTTWSISAISGTSGAVDTSLRFDSFNRPGIAVMTSTNGLKYAAHNGSSWTVYNVDNSATLGDECALAIGPNNMPGLAYEEGATYQVKYAIATDNGWFSYTVANNVEVMNDISVAFNPSGQPTIAFVQNNGEIRYCTSTTNGISWNNSVAFYVGSGNYLSHAISPAGKVCIAVSDWSSQRLKYAELHGTAWVEEVVDTGGGLFCSLAFTAGGRPAIASFSLSGDGEARFASHNGITWTVNRIDNRGYTGQYASLAMDLSGQPVIAYSAASGASIRIARRTPFAIP